MKKLRLKRPVNEEYDCNICAVSKCKKPSTIIDATKKLSELNIPLCDEHWEIRSDNTVLTKDKSMRR